MKKIICSIFACLLLISLFAGCGTTRPSTDITGDGKGEVVFTYLTMLNEPADIALIESEVSKMMNERLGITVDFYPLSILEQSKYSTIIGGGERLDLMCVAFADATKYSDVGMLKKLTEEDIRTYAPDIAAMADSGVPLYIYDSKGNIIGVTTKEITTGTGGSYIIRKSDLEAIGMADEYTDQKRIEYADLDRIFAALKQKFPDSYPSGNTGDVSSNFIATDPLGSVTSKHCGVLNLDAGITSTTVVNYYETAEYKEYLSWMQKWFDSGYVYPDALTTSDNSISLFSSGKFRGTYLDCWGNLRDEYQTRCGEEVVQLQLVDPYVLSAGAGGLTWGIAGTSKNPAAALRFLNEIYVNEQLVNTIQWGIEGTHWKMVDQEAGAITFADGLDASTSGYYNTLGLYGDKEMVYTMMSDGQTVEGLKASKELLATTSQWASERTSPVKGFYWDNSAVTVEIAAVDNVMAQYAASIGIGQDKNYDRFIAELKAAGIDRIIADKQAQLDAYLNSK